MTYQGQRPEVLPGRDGQQFGAYIEETLMEMYKAANAEEIWEEKESQGVDPWAMLFRSSKQKKKFSKYAQKFERYQKRLVFTLLELAKIYLDDDALIPMIGKHEMVNIAEFRSTTPLTHEIVVESVEDTPETMLGRQMTFNHILQYTGNNLDKRQIGSLIKNMPYGNWKQGFSDLTLDDDIVENDMLALDRGEMPEIGEYDDHPYMIKVLTKRTREADFRYLDPQIQENYKTLIVAHEQAETARLEAIKAAQNEFIPADGPLIACDLYVENKEDPSKEPKRARVPQRALSWLLDRLEEQGLTMSTMEQMNQGALAEIAQQFMAKQQNPGLQMPGQPLMQVG